MEGASGLAPGTVIGKYRLIGLLGRGGMGEVWAAHDPDLDRRVAVKLLRHTLAADDDARARLQREGRAMARLRHRNVITVHDAAFLDGRGLIAMELIDGDSLAGWLVKRKPPAEIVRVMIDAGRGLAAAHAAGMIHRDFKPHNVLIDRDGRVVVTDFGLARASEVAPDDDSAPVTPTSIDPDAATATPTPVGELDATATPSTPAMSRRAALDATAAPGGDPLAATAAPTDDALGATAAATPSPTPRSQSRSSRGDLSTTLTETGALLGTPAYMAPEQLRGGAADARSDQYAFCVTAWEAFTGQRPFHGKTFDELAAAVHRGEPGSSAGIPRRLRPILDRGMAREPTARWRSMDELLAAITRAWNRPRRLAIAGGAVAAVAAVTAIVVATRGGTTTVVAGCGDPAAAFAPAWSPTIRANVEKAVHDLPNAASVVAFFDKFSATWQETYADNCKKSSAPDFAARRACLESLREELAPITSIGAALDPTIFSIPDWPRPFANPGHCRDSPRLVPPAPPEDPAIRAEVGRIRAQLLGVRPRMLVRKLPFDEATAILDQARQTGYAPVIAEAELVAAFAAPIDRSTAGMATACAQFGVAGRHAEEASDHRIALEAYLIQLECAQALHTSLQTSGEEISALLTQADLLSDQIANPYQIIHLAALHYDHDYAESNWNSAIEHMAKVRAAQIEVGIGTASTALSEGEARIYRHRGDDLALAEQLMHDGIAGDDDVNFEIGLLRTLMWHQGRIALAPPLPAAKATPRIVHPIAIRVQVVDAGGPVAGAAVAVAPELCADATRVGMEDVDPPVYATTGADGTAELTVEAGALMLARHGETTGAALAPRAGTYTIRLVPAGAITGMVAGQVEYPATDPVDPVARARARELARVILTIDVGGRPLAWQAPIDAAGRWQLPAVLIPGHYRMSAQTISILDDKQAVQAELDVVAGANTAPPVAFPTEPRVIEVVMRPGVAGKAIVFVGAGAPPRTWSELRAGLAAASAVAWRATDPPRTTDRGTKPGDQVARIGVPDGRIIACVAPGARGSASLPVYRSLAPGDDPVEPACSAVVPTEPVTQVIIAPKSR